MSRKNYKVGDIFSFPISNEEFGFGRILFDPYEQGILRKIIDKTSALYFTDKIIFVEIYKDTSTEKGKVPNEFEILIPGIFTGNGFVNKNIWHIYKNIKVNPYEIDFPEFISYGGLEKSVFTKGEIRHEIPLSFKEAEDLNLAPASKPGLIFGELVLYNTGRKDEIKDPNLDVELRNKSKLDLRFSEFKKDIYKLIDNNIIEDYHSYSKENGFDIERFYKQ